MPDAHWDARELASGEISLAAWSGNSQVPGFWIDPSKRDRSLSLQFTTKLDSLAPDQILFDARTANNDGLLISTSEDERIRVTFKSGANEATWRTDKEFIKHGKKQRITVVLDNGPGIILGLVDDRLCDGDGEDLFGWHRYRDLDAVKNHRVRENRPAPRSIDPIPVNESCTAKVNGNRLLSFAIYERALTVSEAINDLQQSFRGQAREAAELRASEEEID